MKLDTCLWSKSKHLRGCPPLLYYGTLHHNNTILLITVFGLKLKYNKKALPGRLGTKLIELYCIYIETLKT